jgi:predicted Zn-ribbon and HTH transcriptional regulator/ribosomal protein S14
MFKILKNKSNERIIVVEVETGEVFEEIREPEEVEIQKNTRKKKRHYHKVSRGEKIKPEKHGKRWSRNYDKCQQCGTDEVKHAGNGLCKNCYQSGLRGGKGEKRHRDAKWSKKTYQRKDDKILPPNSSVANNFTCRDCGHTFQSVLEENEVLCPNCESEHCEIVI